MEDLIVNTLTPLVQGLIAVMIPMLLGILTRYFYKKTGIEVSQDAVAMVEKLAAQAVLKAEGRAMRYVADKGEKVLSRTKHKDAVDKLLAMAPDLTNEEAKHYVDMAVASIPGIGAKDLVTK